MRCVFIGDSGIGKTTFLKRAIHENSETRPTVGVNSMVYISDDVKLHCWDTSGKQRFDVFLLCLPMDVMLLCICLTFQSRTRWKECGTGVHSFKREIIYQIYSF